MGGLFTNSLWLYRFTSYSGYLMIMFGNADFITVDLVKKSLWFQE